MTGSLAQIAELVRRESGISVQPHQHPALRLAVRRAAPPGDVDAFLRLVADPEAGRAALERLVDEVANKETSFFRDAAQLEAIDWRRLLGQARTGGRAEVRVWSAGCSTGEEPYTLAMLACETFGTPAPPVSILGTDLSETALERARHGVYRPRGLRTVDRTLRDCYLTDEDGAYEVRGQLRRLVRFAKHNLVRDPIPPLGEARFDLVLCRNVLIYFERETAERVRGALERATQPGGVLVLGAADALLGTIQRLERPGSRRPALPAGPRRRERSRPRRAVARKGLDDAGAPEPLDAETHFVRGVGELEGGDAHAAVESFRRALFLDPTFALAAFQLAHAFDAAGDPIAARRAHERFLRILEPEDDRYDALLAQIGLADMAAASRARLAVSRSGSS